MHGDLASLPVRRYNFARHRLRARYCARPRLADRSGSGLSQDLALGRRNTGRRSERLTIHNIGHQGKYPASDYDYLGLQHDNFTPAKFEDFGGINMLKGGIVYADLVTTVSPTYAVETRTDIGGAARSGPERQGWEILGHPQRD